MRLSESSQLLGKGSVRYSVVLFFLGFGLLKFTVAEATTMHPLLVHSPSLFWLPRMFGQQLSSDIIGLIESAIAVMMDSRFFAPRLCAIGRFGIAVSLVVTTPGLDPALGAFIVKDVTLLGIALWSAGEALAVERLAARCGNVFAGQPSRRCRNVRVFVLR